MAYMIPAIPGSCAFLARLLCPFPELYFPVSLSPDKGNFIPTTASLVSGHSLLIDVDATIR